MKDRRTMVRQLADVVKISVEPFMSTLNIVSPEDSSDAHTFSEAGTTVNCSQPFYQKNQDNIFVLDISRRMKHGSISMILRTVSENIERVYTCRCYFQALCIFFSDRS